MPGRAVYDLLYRIGAASWRRGWDSGVGPELVRLVEAGTLSPTTLGGNRAIDLGCGTGANVLFLAGSGFDTTGVDFSQAAIERARRQAQELGIAGRATFVEGDVTRPIPNVEGPFDLIVLYNVLQDLDDRGRADIADRTRELARHGTRVLLWCWYGNRRTLPLLSFRGPSRVAPFVVEPGEEQALFGGFRIERTQPQPGPLKAVFLLTRM